MKTALNGRSRKVMIKTGTGLAVKKNAFTFGPNGRYRIAKKTTPNARLAGINRRIAIGSPSSAYPIIQMPAASATLRAANDRI